MIIGDLNAEVDDLPTLKKLIDDDWVDLGSAAAQAAGLEPLPTCQATGTAKPTRRDYIIVNSHLWPMVEDYKGVNNADFPTHAVVQTVINPQGAWGDIPKLRNMGKLSDLWGPPCRA